MKKLLNNNQILYFVSLYYKKNIFSGANKRFDEMGKILVERLGDSFKVILIEGEKPDWIEARNCYFIPSYKSPISRLRAYYCLIKLLRKIRAGIVVSDFMPIPFVGVKRHNHYQLIYDLRNFTSYKRGGLSIFTTLFQKLQLRKSSRIITISEFSKQDLMSKCEIKENKVIVSYCGIQNNYLCHSNIKKEIDILYVATFEKRKNHKNLLAAIKKMGIKLNITFVGRDHGEMSTIKELAIEISSESESKFNFIEKVSEAELMDIYRKSKIFVFPSFVEGFGMPLIEAMASNCKVVCSDIEVFREVCGEGAIYFDPYSSSSISAALLTSISAKNMKIKSYVENFLWENIVNDFLEEIKYY